MLSLSIIANFVPIVNEYKWSRNSITVDVRAIALWLEVTHVYRGATRRSSFGWSLQDFRAPAHRAPEGPRNATTVRTWRGSQGTSCDTHPLPQIPRIGRLQGFMWVRLYITRSPSRGIHENIFRAQKKASVGCRLLATGHFVSFWGRRLFSVYLMVDNDTDDDIYN